MSNEKKYFRKEIEEVDAILPFMSLLIIIIPMLLSNLAFYHFHLIKVSAPGASDPNSTPPAEVKDSEKMVMAQLLLEPKILQLQIIDEENGEPLKTIKKEASVDVSKEMFKYLKDLKERYKKLDTILVTTHVDVLYDQLTNILFPLKTPILTEEQMKRELAGQEVDEESSFKFKIVVLPASEELTI